ncbi:hypothetical protein GCM10011396_27250 [Undibacterium terreum]|uniref:Uncharacterized protein n=1 Tax=Undibacterium terreum TaxID=1224302 RepID=A0A916UMP4_9BURK|nr:hypothetical protein GCM10011396_27250 [Undibacterium terreum]
MLDPVATPESTLIFNRRSPRNIPWQNKQNAAATMATSKPNRMTNTAIAMKNMAVDMRTSTTTIMSMDTVMIITGMSMLIRHKKLSKQHPSPVLSNWR